MRRNRQRQVDRTQHSNRPFFILLVRTTISSPPVTTPDIELSLFICSSLSTPASQTQSFTINGLCEPFDGHIETVEKRTNTQQYGDWYIVTFGTARRDLGGLRPRPVPSSLYQM